jgi:hypothetical protein
MAFKKLSDTPNDTGLAIDVERNRLGRWNGSEFLEIKELPDLPTEDGYYILAVTIESGEPAFSWQEATPPEQNGGE